MISDFAQATPTASGSAEIITATVGSTSEAGTTLIFDGMDAATSKHFKRISSATGLTAGSRVLVAKISGTYIVLGKITA